jgi:hypothetical protein
MQRYHRYYFDSDINHTAVGSNDEMAAETVGWLYSCAGYHVRLPRLIALDNLTTDLF